MSERLRALLEQPLDPRVARAVVWSAAAAFAGLAALWLWAGVGGRATDSDVVPVGRSAPAPASSAPPRAPAPPAASSPASDPGRHAHHHRPRPVQDPQDRRGTSAARRADRALATHRALQHLPYRQGALRITLIGARGPRAVVRVSAPTLAAARSGWRAFLHRFRDNGHSYIPRLKTRRGHRG